MYWKLTDSDQQGTINNEAKKIEADSMYLQAVHALIAKMLSYVNWKAR